MATTRTAWVATAAGIMDAFLAGKKKATRKAYTADLESFRDFMNAETAAEAVAELIRNGDGPAKAYGDLYRVALSEKYHLAATTVNRRTAALRSLTSTARDLQKITWCLRTSYLKTIPGRNTAGPGRDAVYRMFRIAYDQGGLKGPRDLAILWMMYGMALRVSEVVAIDLEDVHIAGQQPGAEIWAKGRHEYQTIPMSERTVEAVDGWRRNRGEHAGPFFTNFSYAHDNNCRMTASGMAKMVKTVGRAAGVETSPHGIRHTAITNAVDRSKDMMKVLAFSRLSDLRTLKIYYDQQAGSAAEIAELISEDM